MSPSAVPRPRRKRNRWIAWVVLACLAALGIFVADSAMGVVHQAAIDESHAADAIVVFGAAEYAGRPSPVLRARLDHAYMLFQRGLAPLVITTGGYGADPTYSEGGVGRDYLIRRGIPDTNLIAETQSDDSAEAAARVAVILRANGMRSCVAVSDAYHMYRIKRLLEAQGAVVYTAPRPDSRPHTSAGRFLAVVREAASYTLWRMHLT